LIRITRRNLTMLAATLLVPRAAVAALSPQQQSTVERVEAYFDDIRTLAATFRQHAPDGSVSTGKLFIDRNRSGMRFDYDPPSKVLLVAPGDWRLIFYDGSIRQVNVIPIGETPLGFLLSQEVKLTGDVTVDAVEETDAAILLTLVRTEAPDQGKVAPPGSRSSGW
jgi:outer membrane lipoprotein-sorting protein